MMKRRLPPVHKIPIRYVRRAVAHVSGFQYVHSPSPFPFLSKTCGFNIMLGVCVCFSSIFNVILQSCANGIGTGGAATVDAAHDEAQRQLALPLAKLRRVTAGGQVGGWLLLGVGYQ